MNLDGPKAEADNAKQIITLSTGALAFTVTFLEKFRHPQTAKRCRCRPASTSRGPCSG